MKLYRYFAIDTTSLRFRINFFALLSISITLFVAGVAMYFSFERNIMARFENEMLSRMDELTSSVGEDNGRIVIVRRPSGVRYDSIGSGAYWQVSVGSEPVAKSMSLGRDFIPAVRGPLSPQSALFGNTAFGAEIYLVRRISTIASRQVEFVVAVDRATLQQTAGSFTYDLVGCLIVIAAAMFVGTLIEAKVGLSPLEMLRTSTHNVRAGKTQRFGKGYPSEVQPLVEDLDNLLDKLEENIKKARDRAGALAHGFKTPLTVLGLEARRLEEGGQHESAELIRQQVSLMRKHVERELIRARVRGGVSKDRPLGANAYTDIQAVFKGVISLVTKMPFADALTFVIDVPVGMRIGMDRDDFTEVIGNLADNARKWASEEVLLRAIDKQTGIRIEIADDGPGFGAHDTGNNVDGTGLGLSVVEDILAAYGTAFEVSRIEGRTVVGFELPVHVG